MSKKLKVRWTPDPDQDLDAVCQPGFGFYLEEFHKRILEEYGSVEHYKRSSEWARIKAEMTAQLPKNNE